MDHAAPPAVTGPTASVDSTGRAVLGLRLAAVASSWNLSAVEATSAIDHALPVARAFVHVLLPEQSTMKTLNRSFYKYVFSTPVLRLRMFNLKSYCYMLYNCGMFDFWLIGCLGEWCFIRASKN